MIKGKKTVASLREAANGELARAKIEANSIADCIRVNLKSLNELAINYPFLFHDAQDLVLKANGDLVALIKVRISEHEHAESEKRRVAEEKTKTEAVQVAPAPQPEPVPVQQIQQQAAPVAQVSQAPAATPAVDDGQRIKLGDITSRLGFTLTADFLSSLGFEPVGQERAAKLYRASDFQRICAALINHIQQAQQSRLAA